MILIVAAIFLSIVLLLVTIFIVIYNKFQRLHNGAETGLSQIEVALKKRIDMILQLAEVVKGYAKFEKGLMENIAKMRSFVGKKNTTNEIDSINSESRSILDKILAVVENYPDLKASKNFNDLMNSIKDVEGEIARQRYTYNNIVQEFNTRLETIPSNIIAKILSYNKLEYLKFEKDGIKNLELEMNN